MSPPELAGDAPVADALQPVRVVVAPPLGHEPERAVAVGCERGPGERLHPDEPLIGEPRLDHRVAAVTVPHRMPVRARPSPAGRPPRTPLPPGGGPRTGPAPGSGRGAARLIRASGVMTSMLGSSCRRPISKSVGSCAGVTFTAPEPKPGSTASSATIGIRRSTSGRRTSRPTRSR